ncbi:phospholipid phosphatase [Enterococcus canis]|uniref:Phospholipid phosphatase n=1 Tax=Enterococcus canis TaxID=214095 RepID=A0A1L8RDJ0_9ENTE|nr:phosphatase PAP2 family protein [Enterococcus canis]OJG17795.1 phospholipid phosphatase [Enterococcus canis]
MQKKLYYQFAASCTLLVFMFLGYVVKFYPEWLRGFDDTVTSWIRGPLFPTATPFFTWITKFANPITLIVLTIVAVWALWFYQHKTAALWLGLNTVLLGGVINPLIKLFFARPRPTLEHLVVEHSFSFPSGHALGSMIFYGTLLFLLNSLIKEKAWRLPLQILLGCLIFLIGTSRIYLGVHFPSDVLAGFLLGSSWLLFSYPYYQKQRVIAHFRK